MLTLFALYLCSMSSELPGFHKFGSQAFQNEYLVRAGDAMAYGGKLWMERDTDILSLE